jgi:hypothetical protein
VDRIGLLVERIVEPIELDEKPRDARSLGVVDRPPVDDEASDLLPHQHRVNRIATQPGRASQKLLEC